jgi:hypothetical protein
MDRKSTSRYYFSLGSTMISWSSQKQGSIVESTIEDEYIVASDANNEANGSKNWFLGSLVTSWR